MRTESFTADTLCGYLKKKKVATLLELKKALDTQSTMTIFRKLKQLHYLSSISHSGRFYTLKRVAKFNTKGLWSYKSILFSYHGTLNQTIISLVENSKMGYSAHEIEKLLNIKPNEAFINLIATNSVFREKVSGRYIYFSINLNTRKRQQLLRSNSDGPTHLGDLKPTVLMNELKAAIIIFFSMLNEKQRRVYAGLESMKIGRGGDKIIADLLGLNVKTVTKGRNELLRDKISIDTIRKSGGGRKRIQKKTFHI